MTTTTTNTAALARIRERAIELARTTKGSGRAKTPKACACGCGGQTRGGTWLPGHDAKALSAMLAEERAALAAPTTETTPDQSAA